MMGMNFPSTPTEGQKYTAPGGPTYTFTAGLWTLDASGGETIIADAAPTAPPQSLWWSSLSGVLSIRYDDGNSQQWVGINASMSAAVVISDTPPETTFPGMLWWESDSGDLSIRYNDGDSEQWVSAFGAAAAQARPFVEIIDFPVAKAFEDVTVPDWAMGCRASGIVYCTSGNNDLYARFSYDGVNFGAAASGAGSYWTNILQQNGSAAAPTSAVSTETNRTFMLITAWAWAGFGSQFYGVIQFGKALVAYPTTLFTSYGVQSGVGATVSVIGGRGFTQDRIKKIRFLGQNQNIGAGTRIMLEWF